MATTDVLLTPSGDLFLVSDEAFPPSILRVDFSEKTKRLALVFQDETAQSMGLDTPVDDVLWPAFDLNEVIYLARMDGDQLADMTVVPLVKTTRYIGSVP